MTRDEIERRTPDVIRLRKKGLTYPDIAMLTGVSRFSIKKICYAEGIDSGASLRPIQTNSGVVPECDECKYWRPLGQGNPDYCCCHYALDNNKARAKEPDGSGFRSFASGVKKGRKWNGVIKLKEAENV